MDNLENEDDSDDIFERSDSESENGDEGSYENVDIENIDVNIETLLEITTAVKMQT